jgi:hypothetical protein
MRFYIGQVYEGQFERGNRKAVVADTRDDGRAGLLRFVDIGNQEWFVWQELHQDGKWRSIGPES